MRYDAVLFDVGHTLIEHYPGGPQLYAAYLAEAGYTLQPGDRARILSALTAAADKQLEQEHRETFRLNDQAFQALLNRALVGVLRDVPDPDALLARLNALPVPLPQRRLIAGVHDVLRALLAKGLRLGIVSNHYVWLPDYLRGMGVYDYFETVVVSAIVGFDKPDPRIMRIALDTMQLPGARCLYVGDDVVDILCSKACGMDCAWIASPSAVLPASVSVREDYRIRTLEELDALTD